MERDHAGRLEENVEGEYFTTVECDGCAYCASVAPDNFEFNKEENIYFVSKQPSTEEEKEFVQEAMEACPVEAISRSPVAVM